MTAAAIDTDALVDSVAVNLLLQGRLPRDPTAAYWAIRSATIHALTQGRYPPSPNLGELSGGWLTDHVLKPIGDALSKVKEEARRIDHQVRGAISDATSTIAHLTMPSGLANLVDKGLALREKIHEEGQRVADVVGPIVAAYYTGGASYWAAAAQAAAQIGGAVAASRQKALQEQINQEENQALASLADAQQQLAQLRYQMGLPSL